MSVDAPTPAVSFVIPLYNSEATIAAVIREIAALKIPGGHEVVVVNDGSRDRTRAVVLELQAEGLVPLTYVEHSRNYGEHNAVLTGWRHARGTHFVTLDDDGQNPPGEGMRLWEAAVREGWDIAYGRYETKRHAAWRNLGSWFTNRMTDWALDKPAGFYLSSFRCVTRFVALEAARNAGPFPYIDGLLLQVTQKIGSIPVKHRAREGGASGYTWSRLVRLWASSFVNFSVTPLRIAIFLGALMGLAGLLAIGFVFYWWCTDQGPAFGWGSLMAALLLFSGVQLLVLGVVGEYIGRMFLIANQRPQSTVREVVRPGS
jgi:glycosyltransferase involved in cell wall biosynthesis